MIYRHKDKMILNYILYYICITHYNSSRHMCYKYKIKYWINTRGLEIFICHAVMIPHPLSTYMHYNYTDIAKLMGSKNILVGDIFLWVILYTQRNLLYNNNNNCLPVKHAPPDSHEETRHNVILYETTEGGTILGDQILLVGGD